ADQLGHANIWRRNLVHHGPKPNNNLLHWTRRHQAGPHQLRPGARGPIAEGLHAAEAEASCPLLSHVVPHGALLPQGPRRQRHTHHQHPQQLQPSQRFCSRGHREDRQFIPAGPPGNHMAYPQPQIHQ
ncbi:hypothetical protein CRUP_020919, partial [Coryphaenoides rupestris]